jgi:hypothetical protein
MKKSKKIKQSITIMIVIENEKNKADLLDLEQKDSIIFINCKGCTFTIPNKINKIIIYDCQDCKFYFTTAISSMEICKCEKLYILLYGEQMTTQLDLVHDSEIHYIKEYGFVISCVTQNCIISTPSRTFRLPYHAFMQQYVTNMKTWETKTKEECLDPEGYMLLN